MSITLHTDIHFPCPQRLQLVINHLNIPLKQTFQYNILKSEQKVTPLQNVMDAMLMPL